MEDIERGYEAPFEKSTIEWAELKEILGLVGNRPTGRPGLRQRWVEGASMAVGIEGLGTSWSTPCPWCRRQGCALYPGTNKDGRRLQVRLDPGPCADRGPTGL